MKAIILGWNRAEVIEIKTKDFDKHFLESRHQCYRIFPDGLTRMRVYKNGIEQESDEVIVFAENGTTPHNTQGLDYNNLALKTDVDLHKDARSDNSPFGRFKFWADTGSSIWKSVAPYLGLIIAGMIVAYAFLS